MKIVNREAMEAHLTLQGWTPASYGSIGARKGNIVWYMFREYNGDGDESFKFGHSLLNPVDPDKHDLEVWYWSDELFWPFARHLQKDATRIKTESVVEHFVRKI